MGPILLGMLLGYFVLVLGGFAGFVYVRAARGARGRVQVDPSYRR